MPGTILCPGATAAIRALPALMEHTSRRRDRQPASKESDNVRSGDAEWVSGRDAESSDWGWRVWLRQDCCVSSLDGVAFGVMICEKHLAG